MRRYPEELKQKVVGLIKDGMPKIEASRKFGIPYCTVIDWSRNIRVMEKEKYPKRLKRQVINLVKKNIRKVDISRMLGIPYSRVQMWTVNIKSKGRNTERITGQSLNLLRELIAKGYAFGDKNPMNRIGYKTLKKYFPVKEVKFGRNTIFYLSGSERKALEALLERRGKRSLSYQELGMMRKAFGIKNIKGNNKIRERSRL